MQHLALDIVKAHDVLVDPLLRFVQATPLEVIPSFCCANHNTQFYVIYKPDEGALNPTVCVTDIKQHHSQDKALKITKFHLDTEPLTTTLQLCLSSQFITYQVWGCSLELRSQVVVFWQTQKYCNGPISCSTLCVISC